jgi:hypothetical protein
VGPRDRTHLTPQRLRRRLPHPHSVTWLSGQPDLRHPRQAGVDQPGKDSSRTGVPEVLPVRAKTTQTRRSRGHRCSRWPRLFANWIPAFRQDPVVEVAGIEPASFDAEPGLLRAQSVSPLSAPPISRTSRCDGPSRCLLSLLHPRPAQEVSHLADARIRAGDEPGLTASSWLIRQRARTPADDCRQLFICNAWLTSSSLPSSARFPWPNDRSRDQSPPV